VSFDPTNPVSRCFAPSGSWDHRYCSFLHFEYLPIAEATATSFAAPLFITALSIPLLGEKVGPRRWAATFVGLLGVLIVVRPGTEAFQPASILPLVAALTWASAGRRHTEDERRRHCPDDPRLFGDYRVVVSQLSFQSCGHRRIGAPSLLEL